jgi:hypothetical protein
MMIRDHLLPLVRSRGTLGPQAGPVRLITWDFGIWHFKHWTPFNSLRPDQAASPGYRQALERQRTFPEMPYGLEIWQCAKLLSMVWAAAECCHVISFARGPWEDDVLKL